MEIRKKISLQFTVIVAVIQLLLSLAIYISFAKSREEDLYTKLEAKAKGVGQMLIDIVEIDAVLLEKIERNNPLSLPYEKIIIYNYQNKLLFSNDDHGEITIDPNLIDQVRLNNRARSRIGQYEVLGKFYTNPNERIVVFVAAVDLYGFKKLSFLRRILTIVFVIGLVIVYFAGRVFAGRAVQPILKVMSQVDRISVSNLNARLDEGPSKDEIARLSATFNKLLERLEASFKMQKSFIANASHEMNTPLTVITGQLEVVLMKTRTNQEYAETITTVLSEIRNLNLLSIKLLMLAQASTELTSTNFALLRIDDLLWQVRSEILARYPEFSVKIEMHEEIDDEDQLTVSGNDMLLKTAIVNIAENGCKYSDNHRVEISLSKMAETLVIHLIDQGIGIPEHELQMIFQPFYRSEAVKNSDGHGIGLSLAEKVIKLHKGKLSVTSQAGQGSDFMIRLPLAKRISQPDTF
ncbi:MAG: sensor histidine kinase [Porphyromonadaceae bacterium]|nr:MAG: sensor histidine kinase [Porphyromonadaceae bacterium]